MSALDFNLGSALLVPDFVRQALGSGLFDHVEDTQLTPLDDIKDWMRSDPWRPGDLFERVEVLLLGEERAARKAVEKAGGRFDLVDYELGRMDDEGYERFDADQAGEILRLALHEADALQAFTRRSLGVDFALSVGFQLPDPRRHPRFAREILEPLLPRIGARVELTGAFQLDLSAPGAHPPLEDRQGVGFARIPCVDPRAGDETVAQLSLAYPLESKAYFMFTFEALCRDLGLGVREAREG